MENRGRKNLRIRRHLQLSLSTRLLLLFIRKQSNPKERKKCSLFFPPGVRYLLHILLVSFLSRSILSTQELSAQQEKRRRSQPDEEEESRKTEESPIHADSKTHSNCMPLSLKERKKERTKERKKNRERLRKRGSGRKVRKEGRSTHKGKYVCLTVFERRKRSVHTAQAATSWNEEPRTSPPLYTVTENRWIYLDTND